MQENWEIHWEDYYEILQVHPSAELEVIRAAYRKLAQKYHPDINKDPAAGERMKKINLAYEVLSDPEKRKHYDSEWFRKVGVTGKSSLPKPKPLVDPQYLRFVDIRPREIQTASFVIKNSGGPYTKIWVSNPDSWVRVVGYSSLTDSDELPLRVEIEAEGYDWDKTYSEIIGVRLDEEETQVKVELQTKPVPVKEEVKVGTRPSTKPTYTPPPPVSPKHGIPTWGKWVIGLAIFGLIVGMVIGLVGQFWPSSTSTPHTQEIIPVPSPSQPMLLKNHAYYSSPGIDDPRLKENLEKWLEETIPSVVKDRYVMGGELSFEIEDYMMIGRHIWVVGSARYGYGYIFCSPDGGDSWEIQWKEPDKLFGGSYPFIIYFSNETEGWVGSKDGLFYTRDGGKNWEFRHVSGEGFYVAEYWFYEDQRIKASFAYGGSYVSLDGGKNWN